MNITSLLIYCTIATFTPGSTNIVILSTVHHLGVKKAMRNTYGATFGFGILLVISAILNTLLIAVIPKIIIVMQIIGSGYMLYLSYLMYAQSPSAKSAANQTATFSSGFLMQFLNPKVVLFTLTVIPTYIMPNYRISFAIAISIIAITGIGFLAFLTWVLFGTIFKPFLEKHTKIFNAIMAASLVYAAVMIWI
ncbi:LysE family translocator [Cohnella boryungensis]|uniref:LysE family translocator n=1 Tax=Cohnella boryungensis TaxID=768479 RepID=A0ABV8SGY8_9BACL